MDRPREEPHGKGFLIIDGRVSGPRHGIKVVAMGFCPQCETEADGWEPPIFDARYMQRISQIMEIQKIKDINAAHRHYLKETGGYIHSCTKCGLSFFIRYTAARIKTGG